MSEEQLNIFVQDAEHLCIGDRVKFDHDRTDDLSEFHTIVDIHHCVDDNPDKIGFFLEGRSIPYILNTWDLVKVLYPCEIALVKDSLNLACELYEINKKAKRTLKHEVFTKYYDLIMWIGYRLQEQLDKQEIPLCVVWSKPYSQFILKENVKENVKEDPDVDCPDCQLTFYESQFRIIPSIKGASGGTYKVFMCPECGCIIKDEKISDEPICTLPPEPDGTEKSF